MRMQLDLISFLLFTFILLSLYLDFIIDVFPMNIKFPLCLAALDISLCLIVLTTYRVKLILRLFLFKITTVYVLKICEVTKSILVLINIATISPLT